MNFLYCFDSNYNLQGLTSINSLIGQSDTKLSIYVIHENPSSITEQIKKSIIKIFTIFVSISLRNKI